MPKPISDRTLILRICDERLRTHLQEKMAAKGEQVAKASSAVAAGNSQNQNNNIGSNLLPKSSREKLIDLDGVSCEPAFPQGSTSSSSSDPTLWNFHCDGATYPARLTNLPCPVELHKTHDHAMYYKCADVAQMLIVYEDQTALEEAESEPKYKVDGFPSYYHSGLTPPMSRVVEKRFKPREHSVIAPPIDQMQEVEKELIQLIETLSTKDTAKKKAPKPAINKELEDVEEVVVDYEPWMDDDGKAPGGIEFDEKDDICKNHPEVWLDPSELKEEKKESNDTTSMSTSAPSTKKKKKKGSNPDAPKAENKGTKKKKEKKKKKSSGNIATSSSAELGPEGVTPTGIDSYVLDSNNMGLDAEVLDLSKFDDIDMDMDIDMGGDVDLGFDFGSL